MQKAEKISTKTDKAKSSFVSIGRITSTFGLKGHVKIISSGDVLGELQTPKVVYLGDKNSNSSSIQLEIKSIKKNSKEYIVLFSGIDSIDKAVQLKSKIILIDQSEIPKLKNSDEYYIYELIGLTPISVGFDLSSFQLVEVMENPAHPILVFKNDEKEILVPFLDRFVKKIDLKNSTIEILDWENWL